MGKQEKLPSTNLGLSPCPVTVTTRIITFLVGDPYKPSFPVLLGGGTTQNKPINSGGRILSFLKFLNFLRPVESSNLRARRLSESLVSDGRHPNAAQKIDGFVGKMILSGSRMASGFSWKNANFKGEDILWERSISQIHLGTLIMIWKQPVRCRPDDPLRNISEEPEKTPVDCDVGPSDTLCIVQVIYNNNFSWLDLTRKIVS